MKAMNKSNRYFRTYEQAQEFALEAGVTIGPPRASSARRGGIKGDEFHGC